MTIAIEKEHYAEILSESFADLDFMKRINPEQFIPCKGTLLIVVPPEIKKIGNIFLPDSAEEMQQRCLARIAAVPPVGFEIKENNDFSYNTESMFKPGMWILFRAGSADPVPFAGRDDLFLLSYTDDVDSNVLGIIQGDLDKFLDSE